MMSNPQFLIGVSIILLCISSLIHSNTQIKLIKTQMRMIKRISNLDVQIKILRADIKYLEKKIEAKEGDE